MTESEIEIIKQRCEQLSVGYARAIDFRDYDAFVELFTDDALLNAGAEIHGKRAIAESLKKRPDKLRSRHILTNYFVDVLAPDHARGIAYLTLYRHVGEESLTAASVPLAGPSAVGHYEDEYRKPADQWLFSKRVLHLAFRLST